MHSSKDDTILILDVEDSYNLIDVYPEDLDSFKIIVPRHTIQNSTTDDNYTIAENLLDFIHDLSETHETHSYYDDIHKNKVIEFNIIQ